jgi:hypothetical protein
LVEGCTESADAQAFVHQAKQRAAYAFTRKWAGKLWQPGCCDRVLRDDEATLAVARYILENPLRAGLVDFPTKYPFIGSTRHRVEDVLDAFCVLCGFCVDRRLRVFGLSCFRGQSSSRNAQRILPVMCARNTGSVTSIQYVKGAK